MPPWAKDATVFTVSITKNTRAGTSFSYVPKPILKMLGNPKRLTFRVKDGSITVEAGD